MKLLISALSLAVLTYACQKEFSSFLKSEKDGGPIQTFFNSNRAETQSFTANSSNYIFINTEKRNSIVFPDNAFVTKNNHDIETQLIDLYSYGVKCKYMGEKLKVKYPKVSYEGKIVNILNSKLFSIDPKTNKDKLKILKKVKPFVTLP